MDMHNLFCALGYKPNIAWQNDDSICLLFTTKMGELDTRKIFVRYAGQRILNDVPPRECCGVQFDPEGLPTDKFVAL
jgi:hypothetical protein